MSHASILQQNIPKLGTGGHSTKVSSNILFDNGMFYSYGYHYPLLFKVNGITFVNTTGYSQSTAKHICRAGVHADYGIKLGRNAPDYNGVVEAVENEMQGLQLEYNNLKRKQTKKASAMVRRLNELTVILMKLKN